MDFGDILDQWDRQTGKPAGKKAVKAELGRLAAESTGGEESGDKGSPSLQKVDPLTAWLRIYGVPNKDAEIAEAAVPPSKQRRRLRAKKADATLDLHGLTRDEAWIAMEEFFRAGQQQEMEKLLIIHGKGIHSEKDAVLKRTVRDFIERCPFAGESGQGEAADGGSGATWVLLKAARKSGDTSD
ncbi:DNA mismatch repair protein MutS [Spirochaetia bacterium]|nr:DNA mismatch repair protein MutS [Spirochaetia bacterium]